VLLTVPSGPRLAIAVLGALMVLALTVNWFPRLTGIWRRSKDRLLADNREAVPVGP
jgi:hypothetical protein